MARIDELILRRKHPDPMDLAREEDPAEGQERQRRLSTGGIQLMRGALMLNSAPDIRESVLDDLRTFFTDSYFSTADHHDAAAREQVAMWSVNLLVYVYLEAEGFVYRVQIDILMATPKPTALGRHLDFGSGAGVTSQLFHSLGYAVDLADTEQGLLEFAVHRLERRGIATRSVRLTSESLPSDSYHAITAIDTLTFVADFRATVLNLRAALSCGGVLFANFDTRHAVRIGWEILPFDDLSPRQKLQAVGFEPEIRLSGGVRRYRAVESRGFEYLGRRARDLALFLALRTYRATRFRR